jgi:flagellar hook assembly protein FlgD
MTGSPTESTLPDKFTLHQNCPNPFNPDTEIKFNLPRSSNVTLEIFDITGRKVTTLINKKLSSGPHSVSWNGRDESGTEVSTGIYLYRLSTGEYSDTRKMLLLK